MSPVQVFKAAICLLLTCGLGLSRENRVNAQVPSEIVKHGKQATALVVLEDSDGSAFCISISGYFITNAHVVDEAKKGEKIHVIVNPGETDQQNLIAQIVRLDKERDLALLKVEQARGLQALALGNDKSLVETALVTAFGYPFGRDLALEKQEFPSVSVSTGHITALRKAKGTLKQIQLDASLNPGNSGGPVLDASGNVVGVVQEGVDGTNLNFAIPVTILAEFLAHSQLAMTPRFLTVATMSREQPFQIEVLPLIRPLDHPTVSMSLTVYKHAPRQFRALMTGPNSFTVQAVAVPQNEVTNYVELSIRDNDKEYSYRIKDKRISIGRYNVNLSDLQFIKPIEGKGVLQNGREILGAVDGMNGLDADNHGVESRLNFSRVAGISVTHLESEIRSVDYEITVKQGAEVVLHSSGEIPIGESVEIGDLAVPAGIQCIRNPANGHFYGAVNLDKLISWEAARAAARSMRYNGLHGHLVTITSAAEQAFVFGHFRGDERLSYWLGGYQDRSAPDYREPDGGWRWVTGEPWSYVNWGGIEPSNSGDVEDYLNIAPTDGHWNDAPLNDGHGYGFIVEFEP
jgi:V8-like Glu-specific endopeptidase